VLASLSFGGIAAIALMLALLFVYKKVFPKAVPWLMLTAGLGLIGIIGRLLDRSAGFLVGITDATTRAVFGVGAPIGLVIVMGTYLFLHLKPRGHPPTKLTKWIALIFPSVLVTVGGIFLGLTMTTEGLVAEVSQVVGELVDSIASEAGR
jgi:hypothetical protein